MMKFKHYIVTRFNIGLYQLINVDPQKWFNERIKVFADITVPSIRKQTCQNFEWVLLFDQQTPTDHARKMKNVLESIPNVRSLFLSLPKDWVFKKYSERGSVTANYTPLVKYIQPQSKYSLQTRLDNDDALMPDAVEKIQMNVITAKNRYIVDIRLGYILDTLKKHAFNAVHPIGSPFLSLFQTNNKNTISVYNNMHRSMVKDVHVRTINERLWVMHVHGNNVSNRVFDWMAQKQINYNELLGTITQ
jgi:hypothetical protein